MTEWKPLNYEGWKLYSLQQYLPNPVCKNSMYINKKIYVSVLPPMTLLMNIKILTIHVYCVKTD